MPTPLVQYLCKSQQAWKYWPITNPSHSFVFFLNNTLYKLITFYFIVVPAIDLNLIYWVMDWEFVSVNPVFVINFFFIRQPHHTRNVNIICSVSLATSLKQCPIRFESKTSDRSRRTIKQLTVDGGTTTYYAGRVLCLLAVSYSKKKYLLSIETNWMINLD